ncbi:MAG: hypothetical protein ACI8PP_002470, partial [Candidatus Pseudothioglobus sp.]
CPLFDAAALCAGFACGSACLVSLYGCQAS